MLCKMCTPVCASARTPQVQKWKYEYSPTRIRLLITEIRTVLTLLGCKQDESKGKQTNEILN